MGETQVSKIVDLVQYQEGSIVSRTIIDMHVTIEEIIVEEDKVWVRITLAGTHTGEYRGLAPTSKKITATSVNIYRIVNGKVAEVWRVSDLLGFYKQLGFIEYTGKAKELFPEDVS